MSYHNIQNGLATALQQILSNPQNHQDVFLFNAYHAAIYNNWQNDVFSRMIGTATVTWEMLSEQNTWPSDCVTHQMREDYVCELIIKMTGAALIARDPNKMRALHPQDQYAVQESLQHAQNLTADLEQFQRTKAAVSRGANTRYGNVSTTHIQKNEPIAPTTRSRYGSTTTAPVVNSTTRNEPEQEDVNEIPFVLKRGNAVDYANHKLSYEMNPKSRRKAPVKDFMGELAKADIVPVTEETAPNLSITKAVAPNSIPVATSIEHAKTLAMIEIANSGGELSEDHILEYAYQQLNTLKVFGDTSALQIFSVSQPSLGTLKLAENVTEAAECIKALLESDNPFAVSIGRRLNARATKITNDELKFRLVVSGDIDDFCEDVHAIPDYLLDLVDGNEEEFLRAWVPSENRILESLRCIFLGPENAEDTEYVNTIMAGDVANRSIFWMDPIYVSFLPIAFYHLGIEPNFSNIGQSFLRKADHPEIYNAFKNVLERSQQTRGDSYQRVIVVTDDNVRLELVETDVQSDVDSSFNILIRAA